MVVVLTVVMDIIVLVEQVVELLVQVKDVLVVIPVQELVQDVTLINI